MKKLHQEAASPARKRGRPSKASRPEGENDSKEETLFLGVRIPKDVHQRLYRAKASLVFSTGQFYGMGRLLERVIRCGLEQVEKELDKLDKLEDKSSSEL